MTVEIVLGIVGGLVLCTPFLIVAIIANNSQNKKSPQNVLFANLSYGLPAPENTRCRIEIKSKNIEISYNNTSAELDISRVLDVSVMEDVDIQKIQTSSTGKAIAGAMMFGAVGAMVGGRQKTKTQITSTKYLVITYEKKESADYLSFELNGDAPEKANVFCDYYAANHENKSYKL